MQLHAAKFRRSYIGCQNDESAVQFGCPLKTFQRDVVCARKSLCITFKYQDFVAWWICSNICTNLHDLLLIMAVWDNPMFQTGFIHQLKAVSCVGIRTSDNHTRQFVPVDYHWSICCHEFELNIDIITFWSNVRFGLQHVQAIANQKKWAKRTIRHNMCRIKRWQ